MPHNFIQMPADTPNPGRRTENDVKDICDTHHGEFVRLLFDARRNPTSAYVLVKDGDVDGMLADFHGQQVTQYFEEHEVRD